MRAAPLTRGSFVVRTVKVPSSAYFDGAAKTVGIGTVQPIARLDVIDGCIRLSKSNTSFAYRQAARRPRCVMAGVFGRIRAWDRRITATGYPCTSSPVSMNSNAAAIRCDSGFNVGGNAGFFRHYPGGPRQSTSWGYHHRTPRKGETYAGLHTSRSQPALGFLEDRADAEGATR